MTTSQHHIRPRPVADVADPLAPCDLLALGDVGWIRRANQPAMRITRISLLPVSMMISTRSFRSESFENAGRFAPARCVTAVTVPPTGARFTCTSVTFMNVPMRVCEAVRSITLIRPSAGARTPSAGGSRSGSRWNQMTRGIANAVTTPTRQSATPAMNAIAATTPTCR